MVERVTSTQHRYDEVHGSIPWQGISFIAFCNFFWLFISFSVHSTYLPFLFVGEIFLAPEQQSRNQTPNARVVYRYSLSILSTYLHTGRYRNYKCMRACLSNHLYTIEIPRKYGST